MKFYWFTYTFQQFKTWRPIPKWKFYFHRGFLGVHGRVGYAGLRSSKVVTLGITW